MRSFAQVSLAAAVLFALPTAHAETLPSLTVPSFSLAFTGYSGELEQGPAPAAAISLVSTGLTSTVINLDSFGGTLHADSEGSAPSYSEVYSTLHFKAADGYRITGISFSATVSGDLALPDVGTGWTEVNYGDSLNFARAAGAIYASGTAPTLTTLYNYGQITAPVTLGGSLQNTGELSEFDFLFSVIAAARVETTYIYYPGHPDPWGERKAWGNAELHYSNPVLTVYTAPAGPLPAVPEPGQWALLLGGLALMVGARRVALKEPTRG